MSDRDRDETGQFTPDHPDEEFIEAVRTNEPAATTEVADAVGVARQTADRRLRDLEDRGQVRSKLAGNSLIWMLSENAESDTES